MKQNDLNRCRIREIPESARKHDKDGNALVWEVTIPAKLNNGRRFRSAYRSKAEAQAILNRKVKAILDHGTTKVLTNEELQFASRVLQIAKQEGITLQEVVQSVEQQARERKDRSTDKRVSELFEYYVKEMSKEDGVTRVWLDSIHDGRNLFIQKWGDLPLAEVKKRHAEELLKHPPPTLKGEARNWKLGSRKKWRSLFSAVWNFGTDHWTDDNGKTYISSNPWKILWLGRKKGRRGLAPIYEDFALLEKVYEILGRTRDDMLPAWELILKAGLRPISEVAGGHSKAARTHDRKFPLPWRTIHLTGGRFGYGFIDTLAFKTEDRGVSRRFVPLHKASRDLFALYKPHFKDSDPVLPGSASAFQQVIDRAFQEAGEELYGKPGSRLGPEGERDLARHSSLSAFLAETDKEGRNINSLDQVILIAGHNGPRMLFDHYIGAMQPHQANRFFELTVPPGFRPSLRKAGPGRLWHPDEAKASRVWGIQNSVAHRTMLQLRNKLQHRDPATGRLKPLTQESQKMINAISSHLKQEKHDSSSNQEATCS